jgi:hypothetical protein
MVHVHTVQAVTERLHGVARYYGGQADLFGTAAKLYTRWMQVPATEAVRARLAAALAELHTEAGWCSHDSGLDGTGHFIRAVRLAATAGDAYGIANAAWYAGVTLIHQGHPNDALKEFQLGQIRLGGLAPGTSTPATRRTDDPRIPALAARLSRQSARTYALLNRPDQAQRYLTKAHNEWAPQDAVERAGRDFETAVIQLDLHRLDPAEQFAASAVHTYGEGCRLGRVWAELLLAEVHVRAGEPPGADAGPPCHRGGEHLAVRRCATATADAAGRRAASPTQQRQPGASPDSPQDRHNTGLTAFTTLTRVQQRWSRCCPGAAYDGSLTGSVGDLW